VFMTGTKLSACGFIILKIPGFRLALYAVSKSFFCSSSDACENFFMADELRFAGNPDDDWPMACACALIPTN